MPKIRMANIEHEGETLSCLYKEVWPPLEIEVYGSIAEASAYLKPPEVDRLVVWERSCGLTKMFPEKCLTCRFVSVGGGPTKMYGERPKARNRSVRTRGGKKPRR